MSAAHRIDASAALVLRDRTNADPQQVFITALYDLIARGAWTHTTAWRGKRTDELRPAAAPPAALPEPLRTVDAALREAVDILGLPLRTKKLAGWLALNAAALPQTAAKRTLDALIADGLLERRGTHLGPSAAGATALAEHPRLPARASLASRHDEVRFTSLKALGPLGARLLCAIADTRTSTRGFAFSTVGAEARGFERSPNGDNLEAVRRYAL